MSGGDRSGYTIVEVLIFMAVSGLMFIVAATFINGKQTEVAFKQGISAVNSQLHSVVNEVANGEYNSLGGYHCLAPTGVGQPVANYAGAYPQGSSNSCIFLGKVVQYNVAANPSAYSVYTIIGRQYAPNSSNSTTSFSQAQPIAVYYPGFGPDLTVRGVLEQGLQMTGMYKCLGDCSNSTPSNARASIGAFGFFGSFGSGNTSTSDSGAQTITTAVVPNVTYGWNEPTTVTHMDTPGGLAGISSSNIISGGSYILLCFKNGQSGSITIGGNDGQQFTINQQVGGFPGVC